MPTLAVSAVARPLGAVVVFLVASLIAATSEADVASNAAIEPAIQKVYPALVRIYVVTEEPTGGRMHRNRAAGSGVIISPDGYVVTNHHVAGNAIRMTCTLADGQEVDATRVGTDPLSDISLLKLKLETRKNPLAPLPFASFGNSDELRVGDVVLAMGSPLSISQSVTQGIVSNTQMIAPRAMSGHFRLDGEDVGQIVRWIGHDAIIFHGNSGGPLVNLRGEIIGINELGLGSLGGAIPSNLVRNVVDQLIKSGRVSRSWIGVEFQPRLKGSPDHTGVLVRGVIEGSPAAAAGIKAGDLVLRINGQEVNGELPEHIPLVNQTVFAAPVGKPLDIVYRREGKEQQVKIVTEQLQRAQAESLELKEWGIAVRDLTRMMALERRRQSTKGALVESIRSGSGSATAKLPLQSGDILLKVNGQTIETSEALKQLTAKILEEESGRPSVLVLFERDTKQMLTVVKLGREENKNRPATANKPWSSLATQVLTSDIAESLGMPRQRGVRVCEVFKGHAAEKAGVKVGDIITAINGREVDASQPGDHDLFETRVRRLSVGSVATVKILRDGKPLEIKLPLQAPSLSDENAKRFTDSDFEFSVREVSFNDRIAEQIPEDLAGVLVQRVETGGWASLGGLTGNDFLMSVNGKPVGSIAELKSILDQIRREKPRQVVFFVRRGIHTLFCEIEPDYR